MARVLKHNVVCKATGKVHGAYATLRGAEFVAASGSFRIEPRQSVQPKITSPSGSVGKRILVKG